ncbi:MAG TPA: aromatic ring-hydroxylating dioxygenase subunit alpha, partial [Thermoanaerobaculia bacterium]|nr:aromatic ring-hydroxylating dioxygenase subunit alpha [Thermoanaerobaculia bacterium]
MEPVTFEPTLARASTIPASWYFDPAMLRAETERVFGRSWQLVGRLDQVQAPGSYFTATVAGEPVIVVRGRDDQLRALSNVCRHRAGPVARGEGSRASFQCGYHGWTYGLDGRLMTTPEFDGVECFVKDDVSLPRFDLDTWDPLIFVRTAPTGPALSDVFGDISARIGQDLGAYRHARRKDWTVECNWKAYVDNYLEGYHIPIVHPGLFKELD